MKEYKVSKRAVTLGFVFVVILFCAAVTLFFGYHARGISIDKAVKKLEECDKRVVQARAEEAKKCEDRLTAQKAVEEVRKEVAKTTPPAKPKPVKKVVVKTAKAAPAPKAAAPAPVLAIVPPAPAPAPVLTLPTFALPKLYTLCIRVVEWSDLFKDAPSMKSSDIGSLISKGLEEGQVKLTARPISFWLVWEGASSLAGKTIVINGKPVKLPNDFADGDGGDGFEIMVTNGKATIAIDPALVGSATVLRVWPDDARMATPLDGLPLVVSSGVLLEQVRAGYSGSYLNFVLNT